MGAGIVEIIGIGLHVGAGQAFGQNKGFQRVLAHDLTCQFQAPDRHFAIMRVGPVVRVNQRGGQRISTRQPDRAARTGAQVGRVQRDPALGHGGNARFNARP